jgi:hypothetical protein
MESKANKDLPSRLEVLNLCQSFWPNEAAAFQLVFRLCQFLCPQTLKEIRFAIEWNFAICTVLKLTIGIFLYRINLFGFIMVRPYVFCEVRTKILNIMRVNSWVVEIKTCRLDFDK